VGRRCVTARDRAQGGGRTRDAAASLPDVRGAIEDNESALHASCVTVRAAGARLLARAWGAVMARIDGADLFALPATLRSARRSALARTMRRPPLRGSVGSRQLLSRPRAGKKQGANKVPWVSNCSCAPPSSAASRRSRSAPGERAARCRRPLTALANAASNRSRRACGPVRRSASETVSSAGLRVTFPAGPRARRFRLQA
jgi:hypothetical protein